VEGCKMIVFKKLIFQIKFLFLFFSGSFFGGFLIGEMGTRDAFRYMGLIAVAGGIAYKLMYIVWLKKFDTVFVMNLLENFELINCF
jgi:hypothetical protein